MTTWHRKKAVVVAAVAAVLACGGLLSRSSHSEESPRIVHGSTVTILYQITIPGKGAFEGPHFAQFIQGQHRLPPALEQVVTGMKTGEEKQVVLSMDIGLGTYDAKKKKLVPRRDLPAGVQVGDILQDHTGKSATVRQLSDSFAVMDYNHPLAGTPIGVKIKILRVDNPS